jgi:hypothetical protein
MSMRKRCNNKASADYRYYGGRGIRVCNEWLYDYAAFREWALSNGYADSLTIDRINVDGNYEPKNCRWVDFKTQSNNRSSNVVFEAGGEKHNIAEWSNILQIKYCTLYARLKKG